MKKIINNYIKWNPSSYAIILLLLIIFSFFSLMGFSLDNDFWFLINTGKTIIKEGFIHIEPFTIHSGLFFLPQQWLTDIIFYFIYNTFGIRGMYYLTIICSAITIYILYKTCYLLCNNKKRTLFITSLVGIFILLWSGVLTTRPQLFDAIIFSLELFLLESFIKKGKPFYLYFLPLMSIFLINYHASMWLMFFVLLVPYYIEIIILKYNKKLSYQVKPLIIITIISLICGFINPYGIESIKYLFNSYGFSKINNLVGEMRAVTMAENNGKIIFMVIFLMLYSFYRNKGYNKIRFFLLFIGLSYLALCHYKGIIFLGIIMPLILGYNFQKNKKDCDIKLRLMDKEIYLSCIVGCLIYIIFFIPLKDGVEIKEFADYLDENTSHDIKLFTGYNDGAYMEYRGYKCYIDPRAEVFLKNNNHVEDIINEYYDLETSKLDPREFLQKYNFDYLLVDENSRLLLYELRNNQHYEKIMSKKNIKLDSMTYLYKNNGGEKNEKSN